MLDEILTEGAAELGLTLDARQLAAYSGYCARLQEENEKMNLTAVTEEREVAQRHFLDSLSLAPLLPVGASVLDVGSGAGFPGLPLAIARPDLHLTLMDSLGKRVDFLRDTCAALGLEADCLQARAEELGHESEYREQYDAAVSRALARLNVLAELCLPFVHEGGLFLAMKASDCAEEVEQAQNAIETLGGALREVRRCTVAGVERAVVVVEKRGPTPENYPRRWARLSRRPL